MNPPAATSEVAEPSLSGQPEASIERAGAVLALPSPAPGQQGERLDWRAGPTLQHDTATSRGDTE